jgi:hypothetical protein
MTKSFFVCVAVALAAGMLPARLSAQEVKPAAGSATPLNLPKMLETLGFEPREASTPAGSRGCEISNMRGGREIVVVLRVSADGRYLEIEAPLTEQGTPKREAAEAYLKLLAFNYDGGLNMFAIHGDRLVLTRRLETAGLKPAVVRKALDSIDGDVRTTTAHWDVPALSPASSGPASAGPTTAAAAAPAGGVTHLRPSPFQIEMP